MAVEAAAQTVVVVEMDLVAVEAVIYQDYLNLIFLHILNMKYKLELGDPVVLEKVVKIQVPLVEALIYMESIRMELKHY